MKQLPILIVTLFLMPSIVHGLEMNIINPVNESTIFNNTIAIDVTGNTSIIAWNFSLDGGANQSFTPNTTLIVAQGPHNLTISAFENVTNTSNSSTVFFTSAFIIVSLIDEETLGSVGAGINARLLNVSTLVTISQNNSNSLGQVNLTGPTFADYRIQVGGPAGSDFPVIRSFPFTFNEANETITICLVQSGSGSFVTLQFTDSFYGIQLGNVTATWSKGDCGDTLDEQVSDTNGFVTQFVIPNTFYTVVAVRSGYSTSSISRTYTSGVFAFFMLRNLLDEILDPQVVLFTFPQRKQLFRNSSPSFAMDITARDGDLQEYGIVAAHSPETLQDDDVLSDGAEKIELARGTIGVGEFLNSNRSIDLRTWGSRRVYVGYFYVIDNIKTWRVWTFEIVDVVPQTAFHIELKSALEEMAAGFGFADTEKALRIFFLMVVGSISGTGAVRKGKAFGVFVMWSSTMIFIYYGFLDDWMMLVIGIISMGLMIDKFGGVFD